MTKRCAGVSFCAIAAFLYACKYMSASIFGSGVTTWSDELYSGMLNYVGSSLSNWSLVSLIVGIGYLVWGEVEETSILTKIQEWAG